MVVYSPFGFTLRFARMLQNMEARCIENGLTIRAKELRAAKVQRIEEARRFKAYRVGFVNSSEFRPSEVL